MITLNINKTLIKVSGWDDIQDRPGFVKDLDSTEHTLESIIGRYTMPEKINCGLSQCHKPHLYGYIVVTQDGLETNIGKDCGTKYFGVDFNTLTKTFDRDTEELENRERLDRFSSSLGKLETTIRDLHAMEKGAYWVYRSLQPLQVNGKGCIKTIARKLATIVKSGTSQLTLPREATKAEIEQQETILGRTLPRPYYIDEPVAEIKGLQALTDEFDLRKLLTVHLNENIKTFKTKNVATLSFTDLKYWVKWVESIELTLETSKSSISLAHQLLARDNLWPLLGIIDDSQERVAFKAYIADLEKPDQ